MSKKLFFLSTLAILSLSLQTYQIDDYLTFYNKMIESDTLSEYVKLDFTMERGLMVKVKKPIILH